MSDQDKRYEATEQRKEQFAAQGKVPRSKDAGWIAGTAAMLAVLVGTREELTRAAAELMRQTLGDLGALDHTTYGRLLDASAGALVRVTVATLVSGSVAATLASAVQTRFRLFPDLLTVDFARLDPRAAIGRLFGLQTTLVELGLSLVRLSIVGVAAWRFSAAEAPLLAHLGRLPTTRAAYEGVTSLGRVLLGCLAGFVAVALLDYGASWLRLQREMRMTRKERADEAKQQDGDPKARGRMRARARAIARQRAIASVKNADVIVTNPTHIAVALRYGPRDPAPVVIAKGHDEVALRIRAEARRLGIPILENRALARALDAEVVVGRSVPQAHYVAVARVLAFVMRLDRRRRHAARGMVDGT